jgi:hypothetical protein
MGACVCFDVTKKGMIFFLRGWRWVVCLFFSLLYGWVWQYILSFREGIIEFSAPNILVAIKGDRSFHPSSGDERCVVRYLSGGDGGVRWGKSCHIFSPERKPMIA